jgi:hypothetical protein
LRPPVSRRIGDLIDSSRSRLAGHHGHRAHAHDSLKRPVVLIASVSTAAAAPWLAVAWQRRQPILAAIAKYVATNTDE